jgi:ABC-2 type transport system permease protein
MLFLEGLPRRTKGKDSKTRRRKLNIIGLFLGIGFIGFFIYSIVVLWRIFKKAGRPGWLVLIPIYRLYIVIKIVGRPGWWFILLCILNLNIFVFYVTGWWFILLCIHILNIFVFYVICQDMARCFAKSESFGDGLFFLMPIFAGILAFGSAEYIGPHPHRGFMAVFKRELKSYFTTPLAYVFLVIFLFFSGYLTFKERFYEMRQADMGAFFRNLPLLFVFMVPSTAMRLWAEERKVGSIELLFTLPITIRQAVLGKFFAAWLFLIIALSLTFPMVITVCYLGNPDVGLIITGYIGSFLMAGGFLAIGCFFSALSKNQVISFVLSVVACAVLVFAGMPTTLNYVSTFVPTGMVSAIENMSFQAHFESIQRGVLKFQDLSYFILLIVGWIAACGIILDDRKAR